MTASNTPGLDGPGARLPVVFVLGVRENFRGAALERDLAAQGIRAQRLDAPDATRWSPGDIEQVYDSLATRIAMYRDLTPAEIACTRGHRMFTERLADAGDAWAILLEDDVDLLGCLADLIPLLQELNGRRAIVLFGAPTYPDPEPWEPHEQLHAGEMTAVRLSEAPWGSWAYAMSGPAARQARHREHSHRVSSTADWPPAWSGATEFWRCAPPLAVHPKDDAGSILNAKRADSLQTIRERSGVKRLLMVSLRLTGAMAVVGRTRGLPFWWLWRRDWRIFLRRRRRALSDWVSRRRTSPPHP